MELDAGSKRDLESNYGRSAIHSAMKLNFSPDQLKEYYKHWSKSYNIDVECQNYAGPQTLTGLLWAQSILLLPTIDVADKALAIMDAGCGTGLVGTVLSEMGYKNLRGCDLSKEMAELARQTGAYVSVDDEIDLHCRNVKYRTGSFDVVTCCGTFTTGHVRPDALIELIRITRVGGLVLISTRKSYFDTHNFGAFYMSLIDSGRIQLAESVVCGPYLEEEEAHYFAFLVTKGDDK